MQAKLLKLRIIHLNLLTVLDKIAFVDTCMRTFTQLVFQIVKVLLVKVILLRFLKQLRYFLFVFLNQLNSAGEIYSSA